MSCVPRVAVLMQHSQCAVSLSSLAWMLAQDLIGFLKEAAFQPPHALSWHTKEGAPERQDKALNNRRTMAAQWPFYARKWRHSHQKDSVNLDPAPAAEAHG